MQHVFSHQEWSRYKQNMRYEDQFRHSMFSLFACLHCRVIVLSPPLFCCCVAFTHTVPCLQTLALSSSLAKPLRLCQPLNTLSWSFWHLTLLPAGLAALQGRRILLLRVCVALGGLESVWKAPWMIFGISHSIVVLPSSQSSGVEMNLWGSNLQSRIQGRKIVPGSRLSSIPGAGGGWTLYHQHDMLRIWQNVHLCRHISHLVSGSSEIPSPGSLI